MIAFLLLLVKTIGREITLNFPVQSSAFDQGGETIPKAQKNIGSPAPNEASSEFRDIGRVNGSTIGTLDRENPARQFRASSAAPFV